MVADIPRRLIVARTATLLVALAASKSPARAIEGTNIAEQRLAELCANRRPSSWSDSERAGVDALIEELARAEAPWNREALRGKWRLAYLQPGPDGAGVDRRIPFPELPFNENFQIFGKNSVVNVGELLGPAVEVRVSGTLSEDDPADLRSPKRFKADITEGALCGAITMGSSEKANIGRACVPLPIKGEGIFDGVYLGSKVRIGQNLNGGGARIVQVRVTSFSGR